MIITGKESKRGTAWRIEAVVANEPLVKMSKVSLAKTRQLFVVAATQRLLDAGDVPASLAFTFRPAPAR